MKHDFQNAVSGAVLQSTGKTRVTMYLDDDVIDYFRDVATANGRGYQTEINAALRELMAKRATQTHRLTISRDSHVEVKVIKASADITWQRKRTVDLAAYEVRKRA